MSKHSPIWHPFTQHAVLTEMTKITGGSGAYLTKDDGDKLLDAIASWWVVTHGHCHPHVIGAIKEQAEKLDQVIFAGHTHEPAERLAQQLLKCTPDGLDYVFFSDSGSTSVEVALKMALGYWHHLGEKRQRIVVMENSYHGDTIGTMSVGERCVFNQPYNPLLFDVAKVPFPTAANEQNTLDELDKLCAQGDVAAFIVEPLVLGAGGMLMYSAETLRALHEICQKHNVLFIADEVMTGWGRTGKMFACEHAQITPDIACYSKGLTGGSLPLAVTMCSSAIYDEHYSMDRSKTFFHSSSYTANPIACAAAVANLEIWENEPVYDRIAKLMQMQSAGLARFKDDDRFTNIRQTGTIAAMDINVKDHGYLSDVGPRLYEFFKSKNLLLRPLGNTLYSMPPYCVTQGDIDQIYDAIAEAADELL
ncbi:MULTISPECIES: adenosylmethionine--8-amino-7-oxononanoate transaminase [unclassified Pseudovibrio]|uniref:adenosylmethionine--8-amino-7-oxononanoate transaminase n=1 Tax=unclassified Pseudovibrio TaxID=2627060 RepID=UPI0007AEB6BC|nr:MULTISPECIES: adenosylmethionine--8-amino-7-oxononanoate transaminase [unclassified Pseudovibrio]KZK85795.1 Adenosylmethionine-8-amino-7-oxononanoate aminotransferase [Pseudovibrio sp. Ad46]KZL10736.1 Adenosylmethionine-8-amino-7-oxononanoate aminotransferase [Pseudovibrio sp. Ad26]